MPEPQRIPPPRSVQNAVKFMYAGAAVEVIALVVALIARNSMKSALLKIHPDYTAAQLHTAVNVQTVSLVTGAAVATGLWLWMAGANGRGREIRATTVVSQPPRFFTARASVPVSRSQVSWTASSASLTEPSSR
jgi:hypothetical protein